MELNRRAFVSGAVTLATASRATGATLSTETVTIDTRTVTGALPHIWEECVGSDRAAITLRESWRNDMERGHKEAGFKRVRFHGLFNDEMGVLAKDIVGRGGTVANFQRIDQVYDGLLARGVSPFVELSFMPKTLASGTLAPLFYKGNITPPTSNAAWADFITSFVTHLVERYGINTVKDWPIEVWNEPNLRFFWSGTQQQYFDMYKATAVAIKSIDPRIQVGGPSTAQAAWLPEFAAYCQTNNAPVDFFSTHVYAGDSQDELFGKDRRVPLNDVIPEVVARARKQVDASAFPAKPLWMTEWSSDSPAMIAHVLSHCLGHCQAMSPWAISAEFEELGVPDFILTEGAQGWGMISAGIALPTFNTYKLLHRLGNRRLEAKGPALASVREGHGVAALVWNLAEVGQAQGVPDATKRRTVKGEAKRIAVEFAGARPGQRVRVSFVDQTRGSPLPAWRKMGSPQYPNVTQLDVLRRSADIALPQIATLGPGGKLMLDLPPEGIALIEFA